MKVQFTKMHALGNDYIFINGWLYPDLIERAAELSRKWSDRHFGIGGDGMIFVLPSEKADCMMRIFNADGSEAEMCGNGIRQAAKFIYDKGIIAKKEMNIDTLAGVKTIQLQVNEKNEMILATVDMGEPIFEPSIIPAVAETGEEGFAKAHLKLENADFDFTLVSMGNPHAVTFVKEPSSLNLELLGKPVEHHTDIFPNRTNVEFVSVQSPDELTMRVWERGSGETLACGTGACASAVAAMVNRKADRKVKIHLLGGDLKIEWNADNNHVYLTGGAEIAFEGEFSDEA